MLQKVRMLKTQRGLHDGEIHPVSFVEGEDYEIGPDLLESFIDLGTVELVTEDGVPPETRGEKSKGDAPHNKAKAAAPSNKSK